MFSIRKATKIDLANINQIIESAVMTWKLPERVKRLSLPSYRYTKIDLAHFEIYIAEKKGQIVGVAAWEEIKNSDAPDGKTGLLLHGIYVSPDNHHKGIGTQLFHSAEVAVKNKLVNGLLVKAQKDSVNFFIKLGMQELQVSDPDKDYANRFWKDI